MNDYQDFNQFLVLAKNSSNDDAYNVFSLQNMHHKLGVSKEGFPIFFIYTNSSISTTQNIILEMLTVEYNVPCTIIEDGNTRKKENFSIISLRNLELELQKNFIEICLMILQKLPYEPSKRELSLEIENLITIFSSIYNLPKKKIQGLWAELLVIERSQEPEVMISAWHNSPSSKFDFTMGSDKIEVKSTSSEQRIHRFSLDQLNPSNNSKLIIASTIVRESAKCDKGLSIRDLYNRIVQKIISIDLKLQLFSTIIQTIGDDYSKIDNIYFDYVVASDTLAFFHGLDVPSIDKKEIPSFVSDVKFNSDLTHLIDIRNSESLFDRSNSQLYNSLF